jgi:hypothetical protein
MGKNDQRAQLICVEHHAVIGFARGGNLRQPQHRVSGDFACSHCCREASAEHDMNVMRGSGRDFISEPDI